MVFDEDIIGPKDSIELELSDRNTRESNIKMTILIPIIVVILTFISFAFISAIILLIINPNFLYTGIILPWQMQLLSALELFFLIVPVIIFRKDWKRKLGFHAENIEKIISESLMGILFGFIVFGVNILVGFIQEIITPNTSEQIDYSFMVSKDPISLIIWVIVMVFFVGFSEETLFRGYLQNQFKRGFTNRYGPHGNILAIVLAAFIFALVHLNIEGFLALFAMGIALGIIFEYRKNIYTVAVAHGVQNAIVILIISMTL